MKNRTKAAIITSIASTGLYAFATKAFFSIAFDRTPFINFFRADRYELTGLAKKGQDWLHAHDKNIFYMTNSEGLKLKAHYFPCENAKRTIIEFHGWNGHWDVDFSGSSPYLHSIGCNLLIVEQRAQEDSEGKHITFGLKERFDVMEWVHWYQNNINPEIPIYLAGLSMGATTVLMTAADPFPPQVKGIIADCGFTSPYEIVRLVGKNAFHIPKHPMMDILNALFQKKTGMALDSWTTIDAMSDSKLPILFIHGDADTFVPPEMTMKAYRACRSPKDILIVEGATHGMSFIEDMDAYLGAIIAWIGKIENR